MRKIRFANPLRRLSLNRLAIGLFLLAISLVIGQAGFILIEDYDWKKLRHEYTNLRENMYNKMCVICIYIKVDKFCYGN